MLDTTETKVERLRSRQEVAALLGIGLSTLSKLEAKGDFPPRVQISERKFGAGPIRPFGNSWMLGRPDPIPSFIS